MAKQGRVNNNENVVLSILVFLLITGLIWISDASLLDSIFLPRVLSFSLLTLLIIVVSFNQLSRILLSHPSLTYLLTFFLIQVLVAVPYRDNFYGESQRINGTLQLTLVSASFLIGILLSKKKLLRVFINSIILNGAIISGILIISRYFTLRISTFLPWALGNLQGGINENFKSMFIALSLLLHLAVFRQGEKSRWKNNLVVASMLTHIIALIIVGSLQGFLLISMATLFLIFASEVKLRKGIPVLTASYVLTYFLFVYLPPLTRQLDSSSVERVYLAKEAIQLLKSASLFVPNPLRISESNLSNPFLSDSTQNNVWVDDVHNVYLNVGNTFGLVLMCIILSSLIILVFDFTKITPVLSRESRVFGAVILATLLVLFITIISPIYFLPLCILIGAYVSLRHENLETTDILIRSDTSKVQYLFNVIAKRLGFPVLVILIFQLTFGSLAMFREYSVQREVREVLVAVFSDTDVSRMKSLYKLGPLLEKSQDLRFIYEVGYSFYLYGDCQEALNVTKVMQKRSPSHFLTRKLNSLHINCISS